jgi:hypothetical protein
MRSHEPAPEPTIQATQPRHQQQAQPGTGRSAPAGAPSVLDAQTMLRLQRTVGNAAVSSLIAQRAGDAPAVLTPTPAPTPAAVPTPDPTKLSGKQWKATADSKWADSSKLEDLDAGFKASLDKFFEILTANNITTGEYTTKRPKERAYLLHYAVEVKNGTTKAKDVPKQDGVDIIWDHGEDAKSVAAAKEMVDAFGIVGPAALESNHIAGKAIDMKFDFTKCTKDGVTKITYKKEGKDVERTLKIDDEAVIGVKAAGKSIASIADRELSKAGDDFGVKRHIDNDIVHWSTTGT